jgi:hypothetical protein
MREHVNDESFFVPSFDLNERRGVVSHNQSNNMCAHLS